MCLVEAVIARKRYGFFLRGEQLTSFPTLDRQKLVFVGLPKDSLDLPELKTLSHLVSGGGIDHPP